MSTCVECGQPVAPDPASSTDVWVHDVDELGDAAYDLNEQHAARPGKPTDPCRRCGFPADQHDEVDLRCPNPDGTL